MKGLGRGAVSSTLRVYENGIWGFRFPRRVESSGSVSTAQLHAGRLESRLYSRAFYPFVAKVVKDATSRNYVLLSRE